MDRFQEMQVFQAVAEEQSFGAAARRLALSAPSVTRAVAGLEARIGTPLLVRTTRSVRVTEAGERFLADCRRILAELEQAEEDAAGTDQVARGALTVTAPVLFGELFVVPLLVDFLESHPGITIRALLVDRVVSMVDEGVDVAVRIGDLPDGGQVAVQVGQVRRVLCAAPDYLARYGRPSHPRDLLDARIVTSSASSLLTEWRFRDGDEELEIRLSARLVVTANQAAIEAARLGWGITRVLSYQVAALVEAGELEILLEAYELSALPIHVVHQGGARVAAKVRAFVDHCAARLRRDAALSR